MNQPCGESQEDFNQVATTFIHPPKNDFADWSLRSFTTAGHEVFGGGHNSLGAWWWLAESRNRMLGEGRNHFTQKIGEELLSTSAIVSCHEAEEYPIQCFVSCSSGRHRLPA
jgi:predicted PhzF superfamily epimerase YddE/YHI9